MVKHIVFFLTFSGLLILNAMQGIANGSVVVDRVVAVVNDEIITLSDLQRETAIKAAEGGSDERLVLDDMINRKLQMAAAKRSGVEVTDKEIADAIADIMKRNNLDATQFNLALIREGMTLEQYKTELREQITLSRLFNKNVRSGVVIDESEVRAFYENNAKLFALPEEIRVRQILLSVPENATPAQTTAVGEKATMLYERAAKGEDFIRLVREASPALGDGDLGFMQLEHALPEIAEATRGLAPGGISRPFLCAGSFRIIRLEEVRTPRQPFEKVKDGIMKTLYDQKMDHTYRSWLQTLRNESHIDNRL